MAADAVDAFYVPLDTWWTLRFLFPAFPVMFVFVSAALRCSVCRQGSHQVLAGSPFLCWSARELRTQWPSAERTRLLIPHTGATALAALDWQPVATLDGVAIYDLPAK